MYKLVNGEYVAMTASDIAELKTVTEEWQVKQAENELKEIIEKRNKLLTDSDWTQLPDVSVDKAAWAAYRQKLRDLTDQTGFPSSVIWPEAPVK